MKKWADRYRAGGKDGMRDRSSWPHGSPQRTASRTERRIVGLRFTRRWGATPHRLPPAPAPIHRRSGSAPLSDAAADRVAHHDRITWYVGRVQKVLARVLTLSLPTVAAVNGHAFGAGAMLAMAHDYRVMRSDRGYLCFPEVDIRLPFTPGMAALIQAKLSAQAAVTAMTTAHRYGGEEARDHGLVEWLLQNRASSTSHSRTPNP